MKKVISAILVATLCCTFVSDNEVVVNAEMNTLNQEQIENGQDMSNMLYYTEAESGNTTLIDMTEVLDEIEDENMDRVSRGNMSNVPRYIVEDEEDKVKGIADERCPVDDANIYPYSAIALVEVVYTNGDKDYGTGFFVSRKTMLTAAHVLVEGNLQIERINVYKACDGFATSPTARASGWYICGNYDDSVPTDYDDDYAILRFSTNISQTWFGLYVPADANNLLGSGRHVAGYPYDKCSIDMSYFPMYSAGGDVIGYHLYRIDHEIDTEQGESGAPVYRYNYSSYQWESIAIQVGGQSTTFFGNTVTVNYGRRITSELYDWLLDNSFISA